jgi:hypothetical protein
MQKKTPQRPGIIPDQNGARRGKCLTSKKACHLVRLIVRTNIKQQTEMRIIDHHGTETIDS